MTPARWTFVVIFFGSLLIGLVMGLVNLVAPGTANITFNGEPATGISGIWVAMFAWGAPSLLFGLIIAGIVALFTRRRKSA